MVNEERPESPSMLAPMDHDSVHNRQGQGSLENSLTSLINTTFQSHPILSSDSGTVDPSHLSSPLNPSGARNFSREDDVTMDDPQLLSSEDENSGGITFYLFLVFVIRSFTINWFLERSPVRPSNKSNSDVQQFHNDDTDDEGETQSCDFAFVFR